MEYFTKQIDIINCDVEFNNDIFDIIANDMDDVKEFAMVSLVSKRFMQAFNEKLKFHKHIHFVRENCYNIFENLSTKHFMIIELAHPEKHPDMIVEVNQLRLENSDNYITKMLESKHIDWIDELQSILDNYIIYDLEMGCKSKKEYLVLSGMNNELSKIINSI